MGVAIVSYLLHLDLGRDDETLKADARYRFDEDLGYMLIEDENCRPRLLVTSDDRCIVFQADEEEKTSWEGAKKFAISCAALDMHVFGHAPLLFRGKPMSEDLVRPKIAALSYDQIVAAIRRDVPPRIIASYEALSTPASNAEEAAHKNYERADLVWQFELFMSAVVPPFATGPTLRPGEVIYRAFDLTGALPGDEPRGNAILIASIQM